MCGHAAYRRHADDVVEVVNEVTKSKLVVDDAARSHAVTFAQDAPLRVEVPAKPSNLAHAIEASLAKLILKPRSVAATISSWILFPAWIGLSLLIERPDLPIVIDGSPQSLVFEDARESNSVAVELCKPRTGLFSCFAVASCAELSAMANCAAEARVLRVEVAAPC
jgi:hypothetical protein